jgi:imidazolonepropionase-like amidohydrolase
MRRFGATSVAVLALACGRTPATTVIPASATSPVAILGVTVIDPAGARDSPPNQLILVDGGVIQYVGAAAEITLPPGTRLFDAQGKFAIPGLWDAHVHFMNTGVTALPLLVAQGVTSVREMGGFLDSTRAWQARIRAGTLVGPRIVTPGPILESPAYLENVRQRSARLDGRLATRVLPYRLGVAGSDDARRVMDSLKTLGVDFVKIRTVSSPAAYYAILREAKRVGLSVAGHPPGAVSLIAASDSGQRDVEHAFVPPSSRMTEAHRDSVYASFARNGTWYTPTLVVSRAVLLSGDSADKLVFGGRAAELDERRRYASPWLLGWWRMQIDERMADTSTVRRRALGEVFASSVRDVHRMHAAGVNILAGTDAGSVLVYPGFGLHDELELLANEAGLGARAALWSAAVGPARLLGLEDRLGVVAPGKIADIVLLDANPIVDVRNTRRIFAVVQGGRVFERAALDRLLRDVRRDVDDGR